MDAPAHRDTAPDHAIRLLDRLDAITCMPERIVQWSIIDTVDPDGRCVLYWCARAQRGVGNHALDVAVAAAESLQRPLVTIIRLGPGPSGTTIRPVAHLIRALPDVTRALVARGSHVVIVDRDGPGIAALASDLRPALVVTDDDCMAGARATRARVARSLSVALVGVDTDVVVPTALLPKAEYAARTIRPKIHRVLDECLSDAPQDGLVAPTLPPPDGFPANDRSIWTTAADATMLPAVIDRLLTSARSTLDGRAGELDDATGPTAATAQLESFIAGGLSGYSSSRNRPELDATSRLSHHVHFGHLSPHDVIRAIRTSDAPGEDIDVFTEEFVVRRELAHNHVLRTPAAGTLDAAPNWARETLARHAADPRVWSYDIDQLESCTTHDGLWNAAQRQMMERGHMHGYVRMYWAKKLLEWGRTPEESFETALQLNDRWSLDGRDPNGIVGVAWAIGGVHDRPWGERPIFGTVRYMSLASTGRKFDSRSYVARWSGDDAASSLF